MSILMLFNLTLTLTNFCLAMFLYPTAVKAALPITQNHLDCGTPDSPAAKINLSPAKTGSSLLPCCIGQNQNNDTAIFAAEKPLTLTASVQAPDDYQISKKYSLLGYTADVWPPPEQMIVDSTVIRI
jgi:hypothetical protein